MSELVGTCNRCGLCCMMGEFRCINLMIEGKPGEPRASRCGRYLDRYDGLPILMVNSEGEILPGIHVCSYGSEDETLGIIERGLGKGCSLEIADG
jgi:hypothetical protein